MGSGAAHTVAFKGPPAMNEQPRDVKPLSAEELYSYGFDELFKIVVTVSGDQPTADEVSKRVLEAGFRSASTITQLTAERDGYRALCVDVAQRLGEPGFSGLLATNDFAFVSELSGGYEGATLGEQFQVPIDEMKSRADTLSAQNAELMEHIKASWPEVISGNDAWEDVVLYGCRYCEAEHVDDPSAEIKHTSTCPLQVLSPHEAPKMGEG